MKPYEEKAHKLIARYCRESYLNANPPKPKRKRKRHTPYSVPEIAEALVKALGIHDEREREHECKRLFEIERSGAWSFI